MTCDRCPLSLRCLADEFPPGRTYVCDGCGMVWHYDETGKCGFTCADPAQLNSILGVKGGDRRKFMKQWFCGNCVKQRQKRQQRRTKGKR